MVQGSAAALDPQVFPKWTPGFQDAAFVVKNTFVEDAEELASAGNSRWRATSAPPLRSTDVELGLCGATKAWSPPSASASTACSDDEGSLDDCEDRVLEALPADVKTDMVQVIHAFFRQRSMSVESCELEIDDEEDEDRMVRATFSVTDEGVDQSSLVKRSLPPSLVAELGPQRLEQHNDSLRLVMGGPFRRTLVDLAFVSA